MEAASPVLYVSLAVVYFVSTALKALQQRHVMHAQYWRMPLVSYLAAACEVSIYGGVTYSVMHEGMTGLPMAAFAIGTGGAVGNVFGTWVHARKHPTNGKPIPLTI